MQKRRGAALLSSTAEAACTQYTYAPMRLIKAYIYHTRALLSSKGIYVAAAAA